MTESMAHRHLTFDSESSTIANAPATGSCEVCGCQEQLRIDHHFFEVAGHRDNTRSGRTLNVRRFRSPYDSAQESGSFRRKTCFESAETLARFPALSPDCPAVRRFAK